MTNLDSILKSIDITLPTNVPLIKAMAFPIWIWELDYKESSVLKNWCFWTLVLEKTLESPLNCKEIQPVHPKGHKSWIFIERTDAEVETPILWLPDVKNWLIWKDPDAGKDWRWEEKGMTEDEIVGWHHQLWTWVWLYPGSWWWTGKHGMLQSLEEEIANTSVFLPGKFHEHRSQMDCSPWSCKELCMTYQLTMHAGAYKKQSTYKKINFIAKSRNDLYYFYLQSIGHMRYMSQTKY